MQYACIHHSYKLLIYLFLQFTVIESRREEILVPDGKVREASAGPEGWMNEVKRGSRLLSWYVQESAFTSGAPVVGEWSCGA